MSITPCRPKWKGTMTDRERFNNQMHYKPVDRCFNMEFGYWEENFSQWEGFVENNITTNAEADIFFNFDKIACVGGYWMYPPFEEKVVSETEDKKIIINADGLLAEVSKDGHSSIPHYIKSSITNPDDWKKCKEEHFSLDHPARKVDVEVLKREHPPDRTYPLGVGCGSMIGKVRDILTVEGLAYAMYDYPEMVEDMVETSCQVVERGGYIPFCDHRCPPNVRYEDYIYYLDLKEEMFGSK